MRTNEKTKEETLDGRIDEQIEATRRYFSKSGRKWTGDTGLKYFSSPASKAEEGTLLDVFFVNEGVAFGMGYATSAYGFRSIKAMEDEIGKLLAAKGIAGCDHTYEKRRKA